ncbi:unnamed protein product, partial [Amoebophrya sp. A25]
TTLQVPTTLPTTTTTEAAAGAASSSASLQQRSATQETTSARNNTPVKTGAGSVDEVEDAGIVVADAVVVTTPSPRGKILCLNSTRGSAEDAPLVLPSNGEEDGEQGEEEEEEDVLGPPPLPRCLQRGSSDRTRGMSV